MTNLTCFVFSNGGAPDVYFLDKLIDIIKKKSYIKTEIYGFLDFSLQRYSIWKEWVVKVLDLLGYKEIGIYNGLDLFYEQSTQTICLNKKLPKISNNIKFEKLFYPLILESYIRAHKDYNQEIIVFCSKKTKKNLLSLPFIKETEIITIPKYFENVKWRDLTKNQNNLPLSYLKDKILEFCRIWKNLHFQFSIISKKEEIESFLGIMSSPTRQKIFYIIIDKENITARRIQNLLKLSGNSISLPAILKHLNELCKSNLIEKKDKTYFAKYKKIQITLAKY